MGVHWTQQVIHDNLPVLKSADLYLNFLCRFFQAAPRLVSDGYIGDEVLGGHLWNTAYHLVSLGVHILPNPCPQLPRGASVGSLAPVYFPRPAWAEGNIWSLPSQPRASLSLSVCSRWMTLVTVLASESFIFAGCPTQWHFPQGSCQRWWGARA